MYALKLELKLNNKERSMLAGCAGFKRVVYNFGLDLLKNSWQFEDIKASDSKRLALRVRRLPTEGNHTVGTGLTAIKKILTNDVMSRPEYSWMREYPSTVYQSALQDLKDAFERWRKGLSEIPVFKAKKDGDSFTVYRTAGVYPEKGKPALPFTNRQLLYPGKKITLPGLGTLRLKEAIPFICSSQTFTISRTANKWFVSFTIDAERVPPIIHKHKAVGIDLGVNVFATLSDQTTYSAPKPMKKAKTRRVTCPPGTAGNNARRLAKIQWRNRSQRLGNRKKGILASKNAKKFYLKQAKLHARVANQRQDFLQKTTTEISKKYYRIRIEDLSVSGMIANRKLSAAISDLGFYEFRRQLEYKQYHYGTRVEIVDRWFPSSKQCLVCKTINTELRLNDRIFRCLNPNCKFLQERDHHASLNLLSAPKEVVRSARP